MAIDWQRFLSDEIGVRLAKAIGQACPARLGYALADVIADRIAANRNSRIVRAVRANQWVVRGKQPEDEGLDQAVREVLHHAARSVFELYRGLAHPREALGSIDLDSSAQFLRLHPERDDRGLMLVSLHLGNFDLMLHTLSMQGIRPLVLTIPNPQGGRRVEYESREKSGANLLPGSFPALRKALRHLQQGGYVATGIDRPIPDPHRRPIFFGQPAALPLHHILLALKAKVPVKLLVTTRRPDGRHVIQASDPMEMEPHPDRETEALQNAERVLRVAEGYIRGAPTQWSVSLPVWPDMPGRAPESPH